jgi:hypothetical protein
MREGMAKKAGCEERTIEARVSFSCRLCLEKNGEEVRVVEEDCDRKGE